MLMEEFMKSNYINEEKEKTKYQELFSSIGQFTGTDTSGFIQILDTPDEEFEEAYPIFKE